jgi:hypothetical protein
MNLKSKTFSVALLLINITLVVTALQSCIHIHHDKFGKECNPERIRLGLPIIEKGWRRDASFYFPAPINTTLWFTDCRTKDITLPYYAYKRIFYTGDTLVAERDTYLNMNFKWFENGKETQNSNDTLQQKFKTYHALEIYYVYKQLDTHGADFTDYALGFHFDIMGKKNEYFDIQTLTQQEAEAILKGWNLKRTNY